MFRKIVSHIAILAFLIVPLFCSCLQKAEANTVGVENCSHDEDSTSAKHDESKSDHHSCNCDHALCAALENLTISQGSLSFVPNLFPVAILIEPISVVLLKSYTHLAYLGPPGRISEVPLYTLYHSLRI